MNEQLYQQIRGIAADVFQVSSQNLTPDSSAETVESWDSVQHLNLVLALEQEFGFEFEPDEMDRMKNIGQIVALVESKRPA